MTPNPEIYFDPEIEGVLIEGLSVGQIKMLKKYYCYMTKDVDLERLDLATKRMQ
jgi:hypothetical protein